MKNKKVGYLTYISLLVLVLCISSASYAYFKKKDESGKQTNINVVSNTTDVITYSAGDPIYIKADQSTFAKGKGNASASTTVSVTLKSGDGEGKSVLDYVYGLSIIENTFTYSSEDGIPEIILTLYDEEGKIITENNNFEFITVTDGNNNEVSGFDITTFPSGLVDFRTIETTSTKTNVHKLTITLVNHDFDQSVNAGAHIEAVAFITSLNMDESRTLASVVSNRTGVKYVSVDNSQRFTGKSVDNYICFGSITPKCKDSDLYRIIGVFDDKVKLISKEFVTPEILGMKNNYMGTTTEAGYKTLNYTGSTALTKLAVYSWNSTGKTWADSDLNLVHLNKIYLNYLDSKNTTNIKWRDLILDADWYSTKFDFDSSNSNSEYFYQYELGDKKDETSKVNAKIGLIYASDYGYASDSKYWTTNLREERNGDNIKNSNWLSIGMWEHTISRTTYLGYDADFLIYPGGWVYSLDMSKYGAGVRPTFYISGDLTYISGSGTSSDPIRVDYVQK